METSELNVIYQGLEGKIFSEKINKQICKLIDNNNLERNTDTLPEIAVAILKETVNKEDFVKSKEIIGYIGAHKKYGSMAHIDILVIDTKQREKGLGTMLIKHMCSTLLELGYTSFSSEVAADNVDAIPLYLKLGANLKSYYSFNIKTEFVLENAIKLEDYFFRKNVS